MLMFRFWSSDPRGSDKTVPVDQPMLDFAKPVQPWIPSTTPLTASPPRPPKRRRQSNAAIASQHAATAAVAAAAAAPAAKRPRTDGDEHGHSHGPKPPKKAALSQVKEGDVSLLTPAPGPTSTSVQPDLERAKEAIEEQFSLEILLKHDELRLINQELAKCQVALEQLRRCHLIPYPVNVPTPEQMLNITNGTGPALQPKAGEKLPQWAPPFGVVDGPYARHYAKWLIPDPKFDGIPYEPLAQSDSSRLRTSVDGRSTRNSLAELGASQSKGRPVRGTAGQKLQALSSGYPPPKDKNGPCVLKRSDGKTVKLVCIDCHRENFSSTQGFINHCRIAHKRDFKSHEEAAVHCGHPIEVAESSSAVGEEKPPVYSAPPSGLVHPLARENALSESEACFSVVRRIQESLDLYRQGRLPGVTSIPTGPEPSTRPSPATEPKSTFSPSADSPHLSRLLQSRGFNGNLGALVSEVKTKIDLDDLSSPEDEEPEEADTLRARNVNSTSGQAGRVRIPARATMSPAVAATRPTSSKGTYPVVPYATPVPTPTPKVASGPEPEITLDEDVLDGAELSPNTAVSNNAPSLVSDDGEYDDSVADSDSDSEVDDSIGAQSISDVDEIDIDDDHSGARGIRHHRGSTGAGAGTTVRLGKDDSKHVTFVSPVKDKGNGKPRRGQGIKSDATR
ncbi:hypothetical protein F4809DRAFT_652541 [Biscogniauxia mediterranea]|nr:hypothetical protein F4809DRAFT_652541 [Biscogniauxia mediterranea]